VRTEQEVRDTERANVLAALNKTRWKVYGRGGAAELLGIKPGTLAARMKKLGLRRPS
jgi:transcriptional regulator with GAF, ATPase, and Fis domain